MTTEGYSNKVLIGNWFEDRIQEDYLKQFSDPNNTANHATVLPNKVIMDFGYVCLKEAKPD